MSKPQRKTVTLPTYAVGKAEPLPLFFEKRPYQGASGRVYPIPYVSEISDECRDRDYIGYVLENQYIRVQLLPELGGKIHSAYDKTSDYDFIYNNKVIKPAMVGLAGPWVAGGIEFNWPQHHRPTTFMPVDSAVGKNGAVYMGEIDYFHKMKGMVAVSVDDKHSFFRADVTVYNNTPTPHPFMWWANLAVEINDAYKIVFPPDVEYVNDHDRRAVLDWPVAKGVYHTARPFNYGEGTDIHTFSAVKVPSSFMISRGQSDYDFVCGYDTERDCGVVTLANHHIAPGKKLWTWGDGKFGAKWCANLTDDASRYVELMTGCYTDNQPDFTWIAPYETKTFTQYWYPVKSIGEVKNANAEGACNFEASEDGYRIGFYSTCARKNCRIALLADDRAVFLDTADVSPERAYVNTVRCDTAYEQLMLVVTDESGVELISYKPERRVKKKPIEPRRPALSPKEIASVEELYLNGIHLRQYKHFAYCPEDYFREGLSRDPDDIRCNKAMGDYCMERGEWETAIDFYTRAIKRLTLRNPNPYDTEPLYRRALCRMRMGDSEGAYNDAYASVWSYPQRSAGYYLLAKLEAKSGRVTAAVEFLRESLSTNTKHLWATYVLGLLTDDKTVRERIETVDPLFFAGLDTEKNAVHFAVELMDFGLTAEAKSVLEGARDGAMKFYYLAEVERMLGNLEAAKRDMALADACPWQEEFPSRTESLAILDHAATPMADYYRGCILYHVGRYAEAVAAWEKTVAVVDFAPAYRNLSLGCFDHLDRADDARRYLETAHRLMPESNRIFYELTQLYRSLNLPLDERLALYENNRELTAQRDDCTLAYSVLCTVNGEYERADEILRAHRFHTYEGGEGNLTQHHAWLRYLSAVRALKAGNTAEAEKLLCDGLVFPENYGEEKNYFVNDAPIYLTLAEIESARGDTEAAKRHLVLADSTKGAPTVHSYFQCEALRRMGREEDARALAASLRKIGETKIANAAVNDYYGVGAPAYPPFGYDIVKAHTLDGSVLCAFAALADGDRACAERLAKQIEALDASHFFLYLLRLILDGKL